MVSVASLCIAGFTRAAGEEHFLYYVREPSGRSFLHTTSMRAAGEEKKYTTSAGLPEFLFFYHLREPPGRSILCILLHGQVIRILSQREPCA